ncbi:hypothetical protein ABW19_dt0203832 [Dactylella cylindrospora]|nr:hypothetical protein ABW19_dt0203832 [Dactylella cylindrospora]
MEKKYPGVAEEVFKKCEEDVRNTPSKDEQYKEIPLDEASHWAIAKGRLVVQVDEALFPYDMEDDEMTAAYMEAIQGITETERTPRTGERAHWYHQECRRLAIQRHKFECHQVRLDGNWEAQIRRL